jgi:hypothetical protein
MKQLQRTALTSISSAPQRIGTVLSDESLLSSAGAMAPLSSTSLISFRAFMASVVSPGPAQLPVDVLRLLTSRETTSIILDVVQKHSKPWR